ncbi:MAG: hypothetical protein ABIH11_08565 [Candidatus Altiarchaeota archaeon]
MKRIIILVVLAVFMSACMSGGDTTETKTTTKDAAATKNTVKGQEGAGIVEKVTDLAVAMASGKSYKCTYTHEGDTVETWISGEKYKTKVSVVNTTYHTISDGTWAYMWEEGADTGTKMNLKEMQELDDDTSQDTTGVSYSDIDEMAAAAMNVECMPTVMSDAVFTPPGYIEFQDLGKTMKQMQDLVKQMEQGGGMPDACSMCDMIPDQQAKQDCLQNC